MQPNPQPVKCDLSEKTQVRLDYLGTQGPPGFEINMFFDSGTAQNIGFMVNGKSLARFARELIRFLHEWYQCQPIEEKEGGALGVMQELLYGDGDGNFHTLCNLCYAPARGMATGSLPLLHGDVVSATGVKLKVMVVEDADGD